MKTALQILVSVGFLVTRCAANEAEVGADKTAPSLPVQEHKVPQGFFYYLAKTHHEDTLSSYTTNPRGSAIYIASRGSILLTASQTQQERFRQTVKQAWSDFKKNRKLFDPPPPPITLYGKADGSFFVDSKPFTRATLSKELARLAAISPQPTVYVSHELGGKAGDAIITTCQDAGLKHAGYRVDY